MTLSPALTEREKTHHCVTHRLIVTTRPPTHPPTADQLHTLSNCCIPNTPFHPRNRMSKNLTPSMILHAEFLLYIICPLPCVLTFPSHAPPTQAFSMLCVLAREVCPKAIIAFPPRSVAGEGRPGNTCACVAPSHSLSFHPQHQCTLPTPLLHPEQRTSEYPTVSNTPPKSHACLR